MKKIIVIMLALAIAFSMAACASTLELESKAESGSADGEVSESGSESSPESDSERIEDGAADGETNESRVDSDVNTDPEGGKTEDSKTEDEDDTEKATESESKEEVETESPYTPPDFTVYDKDGNAVKLSDFKGKPIVVNIWASGCSPCRAEMPDFQEAYEKYGDDVQFLMINYIGFFGETVETASAFVDEQGYTFPVYFDSEHDAAATYGINSIPFTLFITKDYELYTYISGMTNISTVEYYINKIK